MAETEEQDDSDALSVCADALTEVEPLGEGVRVSEAMALLLTAVDCVTDGEEVGEPEAHTVAVAATVAVMLVLAPDVTVLQAVAEPETDTETQDDALILPDEERLGRAETVPDALWQLVRVRAAEALAHEVTAREDEGVAVRVGESDWLVDIDVLPDTELQAEGEAVEAQDRLAPPVALRDGEEDALVQVEPEGVPLGVAVTHCEALDMGETVREAVPDADALAEGVREERAVEEVLGNEEELPEALPPSEADLSALELALGEVNGEALKVPSTLCVSVGREVGELEAEARAVTETVAQAEAVGLPEDVTETDAQPVEEREAVAVAHTEELCVADTEADALLVLHTVPADEVLARPLWEAVGASEAEPLPPTLRDTLRDAAEEAETLWHPLALSVSPTSEGVSCGEGLAVGLCASEALAVRLAAPLPLTLALGVMEGAAEAEMVGRGVAQGVGVAEEHAVAVAKATVGVLLGRGLPLLLSDTAALKVRAAVGVRMALALALPLSLWCRDREACEEGVVLEEALGEGVRVVEAGALALPWGSEGEADALAHPVGSTVIEELRLGRGVEEMLGVSEGEGEALAWAVALEAREAVPCAGLGVPVAEDSGLGLAARGGRAWRGGKG